MKKAMQDIIKKNDADLAQELAEKREALRTFRFGMAGSAMRDVRQARTNRKQVARILTELNARKRAL